MRQHGPRCVSTALAILTHADPEVFQGLINTQNPVSWSEALRRWGQKLAYCPADVRKLGFYMEELIGLDDLFLLTYYTESNPYKILAKPDPKGWVCGSHIVVLHRDKIIDPTTGATIHARKHNCNHFHTKGIFRVLPITHPRGL